MVIHNNSCGVPPPSHTLVAIYYILILLQWRIPNLSLASSFLPLYPVPLLSHPPFSFPLSPILLRSSALSFPVSFLFSPPPNTYTLLSSFILCFPLHVLLHPSPLLLSLTGSRQGQWPCEWHIWISVAHCLRTKLRRHADSTPTDQNVEIAVMW